MLDVAKHFLSLLLLLAPILLLIAMSVSLAGQRGNRMAMIFFAIVGAILGCLYLLEIIGRSQLVAAGHPGKAAMGTAATMVYAYMVTAIAFVVRCRLGVRNPR